MTNHPDNFGKQFDDIINNALSKEEQAKMDLHAQLGATFDDNEDNTEREMRAAGNMSAFRPEEIKYSEEHGFHIRQDSPRGWTHIWAGGPYIEHHHPTQGALDVTNLMDYQQGTFEKLTPDTFRQYTSDWEKMAEEDYPNDYKP